MKTYFSALLLEQNQGLFDWTEELISRTLNSQYYFVLQIISVIFAIGLIVGGILIRRRNHPKIGLWAIILGVVGIISQAIHSVFLYLI